MRVRVLFFGMLKDLTGRTNDVVELPAGARVSDLLTHYGEGTPRLRAYFGSLAVSVNQEYSPSDTVLSENDEVGLLPPVSGGAGSQPGEASGHTALVHEPIRAAEIVERLKAASDGAVTIFDGIVRNHSRGRRTLFLDYEAYEPMAARELEKLAEEALARFEVRDIRIVHRLGRLEIGESSVLIAVASAHRGPAFDACRWTIDTLKKTVPIWKKEHFADGAVWADGEPFPPDVAVKGGESGQSE
jgi:molybdopterin synthase catalytic subunit/molybdopterin converting factor small subunit